MIPMPLIKDGNLKNMILGDIRCPKYFESICDILDYLV